MQLTEIQKFEIIVKHNEGKSIRKIAESMNINKNTVSLWLSRYKNDKNLNRKKTCGKLRKQFNNL